MRHVGLCTCVLCLVEWFVCRCIEMTEMNRHRRGREGRAPTENVRCRVLDTSLLLCSSAPAPGGNDLKENHDTSSRRSTSPYTCLKKKRCVRQRQWRKRFSTMSHVSVAKKDQLRMNLECQACCDSLFVVMSVVRVRGACVR